MYSKKSLPQSRGIWWQKKNKKISPLKEFPESNSITPPYSYYNQPKTIATV